MATTTDVLPGTLDLMVLALVRMRRYSAWWTGCCYDLCRYPAAIG